MQTREKILFISPHTDDSELACAGTMAKYIAEKQDVYCAVFSLCRKSLPEGFPPDTLQAECKEAMNRIGLKADNLIIYDYEVRNFHHHRQDILEDMVKLNKLILPSMVFIPTANDIHQDHQVIHSEALRAFKHSSLLGYELPWNDTQFAPTWFNCLDEKMLEQKIHVLKAYQSQSHRSYMNEEFIRSLARVRGIQCGSKWAEAFETIKYIRR